MTEIRKADPAARRNTAVIVVLGALAGVVLIAALDQGRDALRGWLLDDPARFAIRLRVALLAVAATLTAPLLGFAAWLASLAGRVLRSRQFPPPGQRVIRDTPVVEGQAAITRARGLQLLAACLAAATVAIWLVLWRLAALASDASA